MGSTPVGGTTSLSFFFLHMAIGCAYCSLMESGLREIWVISDGRAGMRNQALGLAEKVAAREDLAIVEKQVTPRAPLSWLPVRFRPAGIKKLGDPPALAIGCGRAAIPYLLAMKRKNWPTKTCYVQDPRINPALFDLVVAPSHDGLSGENVVSTLGAMHRITPARLAEEAAPFRNEIVYFSNPIAVLIGGRSAAYDFTVATANQLCDQVLAAADRNFLITASRRTGEDPAAILKQRLSDRPNIWFYDGVGPNPYFAFLEAGETLLVTQDSVNMATEAVATGKPVFILPQPVRSPRRAEKFERFHGDLYRAERAAPFTGALNGQSQEPFDNAAEAVTRLHKLLNPS